MKKFILALTGIALAFTLSNAKEKLYVDSLHAGSQYLAYPVPAEGIPQLSEYPEGYVPFHMEHYGRHGSRWRLNEREYKNAVDLLQKAADNGKLTPRGQKLLEQVKQLYADSENKYGELTPLGHRQHRGIARRMIKNFPELFTDSTYLDAKSTVVIRCILSMANEVAEFEKTFPGMPTKMDATRDYQYVLAFNSKDTVAKNIQKEAEKLTKQFEATLPKPDAFFNKIFTDRQFVKDSIGEDRIFSRIFDLAVNMQSHDNYESMFDVFTAEELNNEWLARNVDWYLTSGNTPLTKYRTPYNQRVLLRNIIESADTAMVSPNLSANLRFGHESIVLPLTVLMELNNSAYETTDLTTLADHWRNYEIFPMGSNIQIVFFRPLNAKTLNPDDVLVKVMLNEAEATLPLTPVIGKYYAWSDVRDYYMNKLDNFYVLFEE